MTETGNERLKEYVTAMVGDQLFGLPILRVQDVFAPTRVTRVPLAPPEIAGILNGTTNYILTKMTQEGWSFAQALQEAQAKGFAEADPTNDVEGFDVGYKISVLSLIAFKQVVDPLAIHREGITHISAEDIENARELGYAIKLIGLAKTTEDGRLDIRVHPMLIPNQHPLSNVQNEFNAITYSRMIIRNKNFFHLLIY